MSDSLSRSNENLLQLGDEIVQFALKAGADVAEAVIEEGTHLVAKTRLKHPELVEEASSRSLGLRVIIGKQAAYTYTSDMREQGKERLIRDAIELAKLSQPDPFIAFPPVDKLATSYPNLDTFDEKVSLIDAKEALKKAERAEEAALQKDPRITNSEGATFASVQGKSVLVTSRGFRGVTQGTYFSIGVGPIADDKDGKKRQGYHWSAKRHIDDVECLEQVGLKAAEKAIKKIGSKKIKTTVLPVVFDPEAGSSILSLFAGCIVGSSIWRKSSYLAGRIHTLVANPFVHIIDNPLAERAPGSRPFDGEGLVSKCNHVVEKGKLQTYLLDSYSANKLGMTSTASASRSSSGAVGPATTNFILEPGSISADEIIEDTKKGVYITDMMGFGFNSVTGDFSRGASGFLIENGRLSYPVSEITISLNLDNLFKNIDAIANDLELKSSIATPTFRVRNMTIAGE